MIRLLRFCYCSALANYTRGIAQGRPLTAATNVGTTDCKMAQFLDIIGFNRYNSWYHNAGRTDMIVKPIFDEANAWRNRFHKPVLVFEYGGDTMEGYHSVREMLMCNKESKLYIFIPHLAACLHMVRGIPDQAAWQAFSGFR